MVPSEKEFETQSHSTGSIDFWWSVEGKEHVSSIYASCQYDATSTSWSNIILQTMRLGKCLISSVRHVFVNFVHPYGIPNGEQPNKNLLKRPALLATAECLHVFSFWKKAQGETKAMLKKQLLTEGHLAAKQKTKILTWRPTILLWPKIPQRHSAYLRMTKSKTNYHK